MGQRIGYARISAGEQSFDQQRETLNMAGCAVVYEDTVSGNTNRPELAKCLKALGKGDTLVVWRFDRLGRSLSDLVKTVTELKKRGMSFESLTENIRADSTEGKSISCLFAALAEFERNLIQERTYPGLAAAKARGRKGGRKPALTESEVKEVQGLYLAQEIPVTQIAERFNVSRTTIYKFVQQTEATAHGNNKPKVK